MGNIQEAAASEKQKTEPCACRARQVWGTALVECQTNVSSCNWRKSYGDGHFCLHASNLLISKGKFNGQG